MVKMSRTSRMLAAVRECQSLDGRERKSSFLRLFCYKFQVMANGHGGKREGAGHPKGVPGGRTEGAIDIMPRERSPNGQAGSITTRKWAYAEKALAYADEMLKRMVDLARNAESEAVRLAAMDKILDRALGKAPQHIDTTALRHTEIVYRSAQEIRQELLARGVPPVLLDYSSENSGKGG
jgi:hypothetical protein